MDRGLSGKEEMEAEAEEGSRAVGQEIHTANRGMELRRNQQQRRALWPVNQSPWLRGNLTVH